MSAETTDPTLMRDEAVFPMLSDPIAVRDGLQVALRAPPLSLLSPDDRGTAEIVLAEVLNNVVEHAYAYTTGTIFLGLSLSEGGLMCRIQDQGAMMPGGEVPAGTPPDPCDLPEGGFGWHLIRSLSQDLSYRRIGSANTLRFTLPVEQSAC